MTTKLDKWYNQYKLERDKMNHLLRTSTNMHYNAYYHKFKHNSKKVWKGINDLLSKSKRNDHHQTFNLYENGEYLSDPFQISNKFNEFFTNIGPQLSEQIKGYGAHFSKYLPPPVTHSFFLTPTTPMK